MAPKTSGENSVTLTVQEAVTQMAFFSEGPDGQRRPLKAVAAAMNISEKLLYDIADPHRSRELRAHEIPLLTRATENFLLMDVLEYQVQRVAYPVPTADGSGTVQSLTSRAVHAFGLWMQQIERGDLTAADLEQLETTTMTVIAHLRAAVEQRKRAGSPLAPVPRAAVGGEER